MQTITTYNFSGKKALMRVDFNVPLDKTTFKVTDDTRIKGALRSINKILNDGGSVILMSHLGRPDGVPQEKYSLKHIIPVLSKHLNKEVKFANDCIGEQAVKLASELKPGDVLLLENVRFYLEEEGKPKLPENVTEEEKKAAKQEMKLKQKKFTAKLAALGNCYVNDAFGTAHRAHASTTLIASHFPNDSMFGFLINAELEAMDKVLKNSQKPVTAIMGGAKVSDKIGVIENMLPRINNLIIGGGMTYTFIKALNGMIGNSICETDKLELALEILKKAENAGVKVYLPVDAVNADKFDNNAKTCYSKINETPDGFMGLDIGTESIRLFTSVIENSKTILWNGPMGVFEMDNFSKGTVEIAKAIANATDKGAFSLIGGGDSVAAINKFNLASRVSYVSTGGGAMLEYMEGKELPGIKAIKG